MTEREVNVSCSPSLSFFISFFLFLYSLNVKLSACRYKCDVYQSKFHYKCEVYQSKFHYKHSFP